MKTYKIAAIPGDGIGKEVIPADMKKQGKYKGFQLTQKQITEIAAKKRRLGNRIGIKAREASAIEERIVTRKPAVASGLLEWLNETLWHRRHRARGRRHPT